MTEVRTEPYSDKLAWCRGAFTDKQDALLRRDLLEVRADDQAEVQCYTDYYVTCISVNPADAMYKVDVEDDVLDAPV